MTYTETSKDLEDELMINLLPKRLTLVVSIVGSCLSFKQDLSLVLSNVSMNVNF